MDFHTSKNGIPCLRGSGRWVKRSPHSNEEYEECRRLLTPPSQPCRWHLGPYVAPWNGCTPSRILHPPKHNGCVTRQECDVTCWKQLCGRMHFHSCTCGHLDNRGRSSNNKLWKVKPSRGGLRGTASVRLKQSHLAKLPNKISCRTDTTKSVHL